MIEPYNLETNSSMNLMLGEMMEKTFFFLIIFITICIFASLVIWLIRKPYKIRKSNKIWCEEFYNMYFNTSFYTSNTITYSFF